MLARLQTLGVRRLAVIVLAVGLVGVVAVPTILAAPGAPPAQGPVAGAATNAAADSLAATVDGGPTTSGPAAPAARLGRVLRGDATVLRKDGSSTTVHFERGVISAVSSGSIAIKGLDGVTTTFAVSAGTRVRQRGQAIKLGDLAVGQRAIVVGTKNGSGGYDALLVRRILAGRAGAAGSGASAQP